MSDLRIGLDGHKLGTWAGFFVSSHVEVNYGSDVNEDAPGPNIIPINSALAYPSLNPSMFSLRFTQAFSPTTTLTIPCTPFEDEVTTRNARPWRGCSSLATKASFRAAHPGKAPRDAASRARPCAGARGHSAPSS